MIKQDATGKPFVHVKIYKQARVFGEIVFSVGVMRIKCRDCYRWHKIMIVNERPVMQAVSTDEVISVIEGELSGSTQS
jgi:hypothetical protein